MSSLTKRGGIWVLRFYDHQGRQLRRSTRIKVALDPKGKLARQVQRDFDTRQARAQAGLEDPVLSVRAALEKVLAAMSQSTPRWREQTQIRADRWVEWLSGRGVTQVTHVTGELVQAWIDERRLTHSAKTVKTEVGLLKAAAKMANRTLKNRPVSVDAWPSVDRIAPVKPDTIGAYTTSEIKAILEDFDGHWQRKAWRTPIYLLASLGCRWSELERARVSDVDLESVPPRIRFRNAKPKNPKNLYRHVPLSPEVVRVVTGLVEGKKFGDPLVTMPDQHNVTNIMRRCCARLGIQYRRLHGLRHTFITSALERGIPLAVVQYWVGHSSPSTTMGYTHLAGEYGEFADKLLNLAL